MDIICNQNLIGDCKSFPVSNCKDYYRMLDRPVHVEPRVSGKDNSQKMENLSRESLKKSLSYLLSDNPLSKPSVDINPTWGPMLKRKLKIAVR